MQLSGDDIPNVRLNVAKTLLQVGRAIDRKYVCLCFYFFSHPLHIMNASTYIFVEILHSAIWNRFYEESVHYFLGKVYSWCRAKVILKTDANIYFADSLAYVLCPPNFSDVTVSVKS